MNKIPDIGKRTVEVKHYDDGHFEIIFNTPSGERQWSVDHLVTVVNRMFNSDTDRVKQINELLEENRELRAQIHTQP